MKRTLCLDDTKIKKYYFKEIINRISDKAALHCKVAA